MKIKVLIVLLIAVATVVPGRAFAQGPRLNLDRLDRLASQAKETVNVSLDQSMLQAASGFLSGDANDNDPKNAAVKSLIAGLKGVYVRTFEFDRDQAYTDADLESVRSQLRAPWARMISVREKNESVDIYMWPENGQSGGMAILVADRRELVVVNIVGTINLAQLGALEGRLGIPDGLDSLPGFDGGGRGPRPSQPPQPPPPTQPRQPSQPPPPGD